jgi:hypothetical protein
MLLLLLQNIAEGCCQLALWLPVEQPTYAPVSVHVSEARHLLQRCS